MEGQDSRFQPNYDISLCQVLHQYAAAFVEKNQGLRLLRCAGFNGEPDDGLPSWVPRWTSSPYPETISSWEFREDITRTSSTPETTTKEFHSPCFEDSDKKKRLLVLHGQLMDTTKSVGQHDSSNIFKYLAEVFSTIESLAGEKQTFPTAERQWDNMIWTLAIGNAAKSFESEGTTHDYQEAYTELRKYMESKPYEIWEPPDSPTIKNFQEQKEAMWSYVRTAILFAEKLRSAVVAESCNGSPGFVPSASHIGDEIFLVDGATVPIMVRKNHLTGHYWMLGECYFPGLSPQATPQKIRLY